MRQPLLRRIWLFLVVVAWVVNAATAPSVTPIWQKVPRNFKNIVEDHLAIVSVRTRKLGGGDSEMTIDGGELIKRSAERAFKIAQNYKDLTKVSDHIIEVRTKPDLFIHCEAFHYQARMHLKVEALTKRRIRFKVTAGNFRGMTGEFRFVDYKGKTLLGFHSDYRYKVLKMPAFFLDFALEAVLQHVAEEMRDFIEKQ